MAPDPRVSKAHSAMKTLGIPWETVKPVLKHLLKLYDKKWELIEEDNYRTLADAIFELGDDKLNEGNKRAAPLGIDDAMESPLKKSRLGPQDDQLFSTLDTSSMVVGTSSGLKSVKSQFCLGDENVGATNDSFRVPSRNIGKDSISCQLLSGGSNIYPTEVLPDQALNGFRPFNTKLRKISKDCEDKKLVKPKANEFSSQLTNFALPIPRFQSSDSMDGSSTCKVAPGCLLSQQAANDRKKSCSSSATCGNTVDIVFSSCGKVKISLICSQATGKSSSCNLNFDRVLQMVENKYITLYKATGIQFSVMKLLKDLCEGYGELATYKNGKSLLCKSSERHPAPIIVPKVEAPRTHLKSDLDEMVPSFSGSSSSLGLIVAQRQSNLGISKESFQMINDITKGTEKESISLVDEVGDEKLPDFVYVPQNIIYQSAYIHASLARIVDEDCCSSCRGDCLSSSVPCACARDTGGEYAYSPKGLLTEEFLTTCISMNKEPQKHYHFYCKDCPLERAKDRYRPQKCKGHLVRKFIKECWRKCGCNMCCGNRVVQRGITCKLQVFSTREGKGWGLRTLEELPEGSFVCEYVGEILTNMELFERNNGTNGSDRHTYPVLLDADWCSEGVLEDDDALCLDATFYGNVARFINHRCSDANLIEVPVEIETPDHHYYHLAFFTKRKVDALEELTWDYGIDFNDHNHPVKAFKCCCGSGFCRDRKGKGVKSNRRISLSDCVPPISGVKSNLRRVG